MVTSSLLMAEGADGGAGDAFDSEEESNWLVTKRGATSRCQTNAAVISNRVRVIFASARNPGKKRVGMVTLARRQPEWQSACNFDPRALRFGCFRRFLPTAKVFHSTANDGSLQHET